MPASHPVALSLAVGLLIAASTCMGVAAAQVAPASATTSGPRSPPPGSVDAAWWRDGIVRLGHLWNDARNGRSAVGPASERGAEFALSQRVRLIADLRCIELDDRAERLGSEFGPVAANPLMVGLSVGYRFR